MAVMLQQNLKFSAGLIQVIPDANIKLCKQLLKVSCDKRVLHLLEICRTYYAVESGVAAMCVGHVVHAVHHTHQTHDPKPLTCYTLCPNCTCQHVPGRHNCPAHNLVCKGCGKKVHWWAKCQSCNTTSPQASHHQPHFKNCEKGREPQAAKAKTEKKPPTQRPVHCCNGLQNGRRCTPKGDDTITQPMITLNVADHVCIYFYNFNHKNFYQGIRKFTYSIMNMLRQQKDRIKWILCIISLGFLVFYFISLWESLRDNLLVHGLWPIHYSYNRQQLLNIYSTVRSVSSYNTISKTCWGKT